MNKIREYLPADWNRKRERSILFADILGFSQLVLNSSHVQFLKKFRSFIERLKSLRLPLQAGNHLRLTIFSDTIVIGTNSCTLRNFNLIVKAAAILQFVCFDFKWPLNGCISCGTLTFNIPILTPQEIDEYKHKKIVPFNVPILLGNSIIKAYEINNDLLCYGIVLHDTAVSLLLASLNNPNLKFHHPFSLISVPLKSNKPSSLYYLSWTEVTTQVNKGGFEKITFIDWLSKLEKGETTRVIEYVKNTKEILNQIGEK